MNLTELKWKAEDIAVEYLNCHPRLEALEEKALLQLKKSDYVRLHKLEFSALLSAVRGLQRKRQTLEAMLTEYRVREHDASVKADAAITSIFGWPWEPNAQRTYALLVTAFERIAKLEQSESDKPMESPKE